MKRKYLMLLFLILAVGALVAAASPAIRVNNATPRGPSTFALGVPSFPRYENPKAPGFAVDSLVQDLAYPATNQLWDFPESTDKELAFEFVKKLAETGKPTFHQIYVFNGPGVRKKTSTFWNTTLGKPASVNDVKKALLTNPKAHDAVRNEFAEVVAYAKSMEALGVVVYICPELEDNENLQTYQILLALLQQAGWTTPDGNLRFNQVVRSTVVGGQRGLIPQIHTEIHSPSLSTLLRGKYGLRPGDVINMDGKSVDFLKRRGGYYTPKEVEQMIKWSEANGVVFFLWYHRLQGFKDYKHGGSSKLDGAYNKRNYILDLPLHFKSVLETQ